MAKKSNKGKGRKPHRHRSIEEYEVALRKAQGFTSVAAQMLGVTVRAVNKRIKGSKTLQRVTEELREFNLDVAESKLLAKVNSGETKAIFYFLNNQGKKRGYGRKWWDSDGAGQEDIDKVKWTDPGRPPRPEEDIDDAEVLNDLQRILPEGCTATHEDLGLNGKGAGGNGERVNGDT